MASRERERDGEERSDRVDTGSDQCVQVAVPDHSI